MIATEWQERSALLAAKRLCSHCQHDGRTCKLMRQGELAIEVRTDGRSQRVWLKQGDFTQTISSEYIRAALSRAVRLYECNVHAIHAIRPYNTFA